MRKIIERILFVLALTRCLPSQPKFPFVVNVAARDGTSLLMIGNSFTDANDLEVMIESMLEEDVTMGKVYCLRFRKPASRFADDIQNDNLRSTIAERAWTWVVLQEQSQIPGFYDLPNSGFDLSLNATILMNQWIKDANAETVLMMTWGRRKYDSMNPTLYPDFLTMQSKLKFGYERYQQVTSEPDRPVRIAPAGLAFQTLHDSLLPADPTADGTIFSDLYLEDGVHPSLQGSYLVACVVYATLSGNDPRRLKYAPREIDMERVRALREAAATTMNAFNQENDVNRQFFNSASNNDTQHAKQKHKKPYVPPGGGDPSNEQRNDPTSFSKVLLFFFSAFAILAIVYIQRQRKTRARPKYMMMPPGHTDHDMELVDVAANFSANSFQ